MAINIPAGRRVHIFSREQEVTTGADFLLEEDLTLSINSSFSPLVNTSANPGLVQLGNLVSGLTGFGFSGQFKQAGFQTWTGTDPLRVSFNVGLYMRTNALTDVVTPAKRLLRVAVPYETSLGNESGARGIGLVPPGPSLLEVLNEVPTDRSPHPGKQLSLQIGNTLYLSRIIITSAEPTFASETDTNDYPIWCKIKVDVSSIFTATVQLIDNGIGVGG